MAYAIKRDGAWIELSGSFTAGEGHASISYPDGWLENATPEQRAEIGAAEIVEEPPVATSLQLLGQEVVDVAGVPHRRWVTPPAADVRVARRAELAAVRWNKQQTVKWQGRIAQADDTTLGRLMAAVLRAQLAQDPTFSIRWKFGDDDFAALSIADVTSYGTAIGNHLQACYDREAQLATAIGAAGDAAAVAAIDLTAGWPA